MPRLCAALARAGAEITLLSVAGAGDRENDYPPARGYRDDRFVWDHARIPLLRQLRKSSGLSDALRLAAPGVDLIHNHGLWLLPNVYSGREAARAGTPLVVSPRGMLSAAALRFSPLKKAAFWRLVQANPVRHAACLHATSAEEYEEIRAFGLTNPVAVIGNGIDIPNAPEAAERPEAADRVVLSLGRLHPSKGLQNLLHAWAKVEESHPDWRLRILGPAERGHELVLRALRDSLRLARVSIEGPIYGDEMKLEAYREASLFVLPSLTENFGLTVAEALAAGTPAIATKGTPWRGLETERCGWWIDHGIDPLAAALSRAMRLPRETLTAMGGEGRDWMAREYSWDRIAGEMLAVYRWVRKGGDCPSSLRLR